MVRVVFSRRDAADTANRAGVLNSSLDGQLSPETDILVVAAEKR